MSQNTSKHRSYEDADTMAGNAMHGRSQHLAPSRRNISFVQSGERLATAKYVEKPAYHAGICRQQHEAPFEDRRFRRIADVNGDEQQSSRREDKPQQHPRRPTSRPPWCRVHRVPLTLGTGLDRSIAITVSHADQVERPPSGAVERAGARVGIRRTAILAAARMSPIS
jgi:hypothetical protein